MVKGRAVLVLLATVVASLAQPATNTNEMRRIGGAEGAAPPEASKGGLLSFTDIPGIFLTLDPKLTEDSAVGLDYRFSYDHLYGDAEVAGTKYSLGLRSEGFLATQEEENPNSIISELRFAGHLFLAGKVTPLPPAEQLRVRELLNVEDLAFMDPKSDQVKEYNLLMRGPGQMRTIPRFATFDVHLKNEAEADFDTTQNAIGAGFTSDLGLITGNDFFARVFDFPFRATRTAEVNAFYQPRLPRFFVGYDYVFGAERPDEEQFHRLTAQFAWSTLFFNNLIVRVAQQVYYEPDSPASVKAAGKDWTTFFEASVAVPIDATKRTRIFVKYTNGELPPTLRESSQVALGFSVGWGGAQKEKFSETADHEKLRQ